VKTTTPTRSPSNPSKEQLRRRIFTTGLKKNQPYAHLTPCITAENTRGITTLVYKNKGHTHIEYRRTPKIIDLGPCSPATSRAGNMGPASTPL
jgi:hypothetical protein